jgi:hypothetical protein
MKNKRSIALPGTFAIALALTPLAHADVVDQLLQEYQARGATAFSPDHGDAFWHKSHPDPKEPGKTRSCTTCHGENLKVPGKHATTGKTIEPLAPSVNKKRLTDAKEIEKWFTRNCKWVLGRECTPQEKGDILSYLRQQ